MARKMVTVRELRSRFSELMGRAAYGNEEIVVTKNGSEHVAIIGIDELNRFHELEDQLDAFMAERAGEEARKHGTIPHDEALRILGIGDDENRVESSDKTGSEENRAGKVAEDRGRYS